ncbi:MAG TPA: hypothetical protein VFW68_12350 [Rhodocyclaceae bacterium]|nr:hypothetical protein [Rhodocyclaceae bacterium]
MICRIGGGALLGSLRCTLCLLQLPENKGWHRRHWVPSGVFAGLDGQHGGDYLVRIVSCLKRGSLGILIGKPAFDAMGSAVWVLSF